MVLTLCFVSLWWKGASFTSISTCSLSLNFENDSCASAFTLSPSVKTAFFKLSNCALSLTTYTSIIILFRTVTTFGRVCSLNLKTSLNYIFRNFQSRPLQAAADSFLNINYIFHVYKSARVCSGFNDINSSSDGEHEGLYLSPRARLVFVTSWTRLWTIYITVHQLRMHPGWGISSRSSK